jgi:hypothetical protein
MKLKLTFFSILLLLPVLIVSGCNIFGWTTSTSADSLIEEGKELMRDTDYSGAQAKFAEAMAEDPNSSDARYYHAKATLRAAGYNALSLAKAVSDSSFNEGDFLPFTGTEWPVAKANGLYQAMLTIRRDLKPIYENDPNLTGNFKRLDIDLDYGLAGGFVGILYFRDANADDKITDDDPDLGVRYEESGETGFAINNLVGYFESFGTPKIASPMDTVPIPQAAIDALDSLLSRIIVIIDESRDIIVEVLTRNSSDLDVDEINQVLDDVVILLNKYYIQIGVDNDGDGFIDEEVIDGCDNDHDGLIDEDSDGTYDNASPCL